MKIKDWLEMKLIERDIRLSMGYTLPSQKQRLKELRGRI